MSNLAQTSRGPRINVTTIETSDPEHDHEGRQLAAGKRVEGINSLAESKSEQGNERYQRRSFQARTLRDGIWLNASCAGSFKNLVNAAVARQPNQRCKGVWFFRPARDRVEEKRFPKRPGCHPSNESAPKTGALPKFNLQSLRQRP
jgi:hypothetical protein